MRSRDIQLNEGFVANSIEKSKQDQLRGREGGAHLLLLSNLGLTR